MAKRDGRKDRRHKRARAAARHAEQARVTDEGQIQVPPELEQYVAGLLARRQETADEGWLAELEAMGERGHPGEAIGQIEPFVRDHLYDERAALTYTRLLRQAAAMDPKGDRDHEALERFSDRSGLVEVKRVVIGFLEEHRDWHEFVIDRAAQDLRLVPGKLLPGDALSECTAVIFEANVRGADLAMRWNTDREVVGLHRGNHQPRTPLMAFAEDPGTPSHLAKRAADWAEYGHYGLWQLHDPAPSPGVEGRDLATGTRRYLNFPAGKLDGVAPWSVWLGCAIPVDGVWEITGDGIMLSPGEGDTIAEALQDVITMMIGTAQGMPLAELNPLRPIPWDDPPPHGVRWDYLPVPDRMPGTGRSDILMMLAGRFLAEVTLHRTRGPRPGASGHMPAGDGWADAPLTSLQGLTPREAATADLPDQMLLESMLRTLEYRAALALPGEDAPDVATLRRTLGMSSTK
jgi:hypothetical protein